MYFLHYFGAAGAVGVAGVAMLTLIREGAARCTAKRQNTDVTLYHVLGCVIFAFIIACMLYVAGLPGYGAVRLTHINWTPFIDIDLNPMMYILNVVMFVPFGMMIPVLWRNYRSVKKVMLASFLFSLVIEVSQLFNYRATDIDDLMMNTLGGAAGYAVFKLTGVFMGKLYQKSGIMPKTVILTHECWFISALVYCGLYIVRIL